MANVKARPTHRVIFRAWITSKDGTRIYASQYGLKAFRLLVRR